MHSIPPRRGLTAAFLSAALAMVGGGAAAQDGDPVTLTLAPG